MLTYRGKAADFGAFLLRTVGKVGYLIGTRGQTCTKELIQRSWNSFATYRNTIDAYAAQWIGQVVADCMGWYEMFLNGGDWDKPLTSWLYSDVSTGTMWALAVSENLPRGAIATLPKDRTVPIAVSYPGHVGFYYQGKVYQSAGHKSGTIITDLTSTSHNKAWEYWYELPYLDYTEVNELIYCQLNDGRETATSSSPAVRALQEGLVKLGHKMINNGIEYPPDGRYGTATVNGVQLFLVANGLPGSGNVFDSDSITVMLAKLAALNTSTGITQAMLNAEIAKVAAIKAELDAAEKKILEQSQEIAACKNAILVEQGRTESYIKADADKRLELAGVADAFETLKKIYDRY